MKKNTGIPKEQKDLPAGVVALLGERGGKGLKAKEIAHALQIGNHDYLELRKTLRQLAEQGRIVRLPKNRFGALVKTQAITGALRVNSQGYGFVVREDGGEDVFISRKNMGTALHRDHVAVQLFAVRTGAKPEGRVVEILTRGRNHIVGTFRTAQRYAYVVPDDIKIQTDILISDPEQYQVSDGQKVVAIIDAWPDAHMNPVGHITEVLGLPDERGVDVLSIVHSFDLSATFPPAVEEEAGRQPAGIPESEYRHRLDLRSWLTFTIDPEDAKDFDDAVSLRTLDGGRLQLGVHIADVSHYVRPGTLTDEQAQARGTAVYLVDRVLPMLPERLSNELCSLTPGGDKLCFSVIMDLTPAAEVVNCQICETIIRSQRRFSYEEAQALLQSDADDPYATTLREMFDLSRRLIAKRNRRGSIDFESLEVKVVLDEAGHPAQLKRRERLDTHRLIEEFMLLTNETVAKEVGVKLTQATEQEHPFVYRVHEKPDRDKVMNLLALAKTFGFEFSPLKRITPGYFQGISQAFAEHPASAVLQDALLRTMMKAKYTTVNVGHFGLAYTHYTHFTSPIRRYPDLMVHRLLKQYKGIGPRPEVPAEQALESRCQAASDAEVRAQEAERASVKMKQAEFMEAQLGREFDGYICRIVPFGFFVHLPEFLLDGLVHLSDLRDDYYEFDEARHQLVGRRNGQIYRLGDRVRIRVSRVDRNERLIDFVLIGAISTSREKARQEKGPAANDRKGKDKGKSPRRSDKKPVKARGRARSKRQR
jgi:ribonuclease R